METTFSAIEEVRKYYKLKYNEKELKERGYESIEDFINAEHYGNPWAAVGDIVEDVIFAGHEDLIGTDLDSIVFEKDE